MIGKGKKYVKVFQPSKACRLSWSELVVYSYLAYQDAYGEFPPAMRVVRATGLARNTVKAAISRLAELGLVQDQHVQAPFPGWFAAAKRRDGSHWRDSLAYWHLLVRAPSSELTSIQAGLLCYLWHCSRTNYAPRNGWSIRLLSILFRAKRETIKAALVVLQANDLLRFQVRGKEGVSITIQTPRQFHLEHFQNTAEQEEREEHFIIETDILPDVKEHEAENDFGMLRLNTPSSETMTDEEWFTRELRRKMSDGEERAKSVIQSDLWQQHKDDCLDAATEASGGLILHRLTLLRREAVIQQEALA